MSLPCKLFKNQIEEIQIVWKLKFFIQILFKSFGPVSDDHFESSLYADIVNVFCIYLTFASRLPVIHWIRVLSV